jgi:Ca2+-binding RTX toxin-like protein
MPAVVTKIELSPLGIEVNYADGTKEEIEAGRYELKDASGRTIEERDATEADLARLTALIGDATVVTREVTLDDGTKIEVGPNQIEVEYPDGTKEEIENGIYERKNAEGDTVEERAATDADRARLEAMIPDNFDDFFTDGLLDDTPSPSETYHGTTGDDRYAGDDGDDDLDGDDGDDRLRGRDGDDDLDGGDGEDRLRGGDGDDTMTGGTGDDRLRGGRGDDTLDGGADDDRVRGEKGNDTVAGGDGMDRVRGDAGDDTVYGGAGDDRVRGGKGDDMLYGGTGDDRIWTNDGTDVIVFVPGDGADRIHSFDPGIDTVDLTAFGLADFDALAALVVDATEDDVTFDLGGGDSLEFDDLNLADLSGDDFLF